MRTGRGLGTAVLWVALSRSTPVHGAPHLIIGNPMTTQP